MFQYGLMLLAVTMFAGAVCAQNVIVKVDWDRMTDFTPYKTYKWTKIPTPRTPTDEIETLIHSQVDTQLEAKGLKRIKDGETDLEVGYRVTLSEPKKKGVAAPDSEGTWQTGSSWSSQADASPDRKGNLGIDIQDRNKQLLVWRVTILADIGYSGHDSRTKIAKGITKAFAKFPPPVK